MEKQNKKTEVKQENEVKKQVKKNTKKKEKPILVNENPFDATKDVIVVDEKTPSPKPRKKQKTKKPEVETNYITPVKEAQITEVNNVTEKDNKTKKKKCIFKEIPKWGKWAIGILFGVLILVLLFV